MTHLTAYKTRLVILTFLVRTITTRTLLDGTFTGTLIPTLRPTSTLHPVTTATIPYTRSTPETITHILQLYNICVAHNCLPMSRTKKKAKDRQWVVYNIKCCDCQASYIGKTGRNPSTRLTQHKRVTRNGDVNSHIAEHHLQTKHQIVWDSVTCITYSTDYYQHLTLESWPGLFKGWIALSGCPAAWLLKNRKIGNSGLRKKEK